MIRHICFTFNGNCPDAVEFCQSDPGIPAPGIPAPGIPYVDVLMLSSST